jgi:hypothetical protein
VIEEVLQNIKDEVEKRKSEAEAAKQSAVQKVEQRKRKQYLSSKNPPSTKRKQNPHWYRTEPVPSFSRNVWPILQKKLRFKYNKGSGYYTLPLGGSFCKRAIDLRSYLVKHGIPNIKCASEEECKVLERWVAFAHVPVKEGNIMEKTRELSNDEASDFLLKELGFELLPDGSFRCDNQMFKSLEEVRVYFRGTESLQGRHHKQQNDISISKEKILQFRLWAALSPTSLPLFSVSSS